ncbi:MAG TPA: hypothetical protein VER08_02420 [Pyrinomonadaceae bacterium]|nr:hypothetical protein [Pyrinomonadaceae bacterium]
MTTEKIPTQLEVPLASLAELAVEWWRLGRWLAERAEEAQSSHARHLARRLGRFLEERGLAVVDLTAQQYTPGLAVEVLDVLADETLPEGREVVDEMVAPVVTWRGAVVRYGQVVVRRRNA